MKTVTTSAKKTVTKAKPVKFFGLSNRPISQGKLFAHTHAALMFFGMLTAARTAAPRIALEHVMGKRAIGNHLHEGNMQVQGSNVRLSVDGLAKFSSRPRAEGFDNTLAEVFFAAISKGKAAPAYGIEQRHLQEMVYYS